MDVYERLQADDLRWNALVVATFAMQAANRPAKLPRKPAPAAPAAPAQESGLPPVTR
jgi:hypothetical protein